MLIIAGHYLVDALQRDAYVEAYRQTERPRYAQIARGVFDFVLRNKRQENPRKKHGNIPL